MVEFTLVLSIIFIPDALILSNKSTEDECDSSGHDENELNQSFRNVDEDNEHASHMMSLDLGTSSPRLSIEKVEIGVNSINLGSDDDASIVRDMNSASNSRDSQERLLSKDNSSTIVPPMGSFFSTGNPNRREYT